MHAAVKCKCHPSEFFWFDGFRRRKGTFVHSTRDEVPADVIGQVKDWEDGQLSVEIQGETVSEKPKNLIRCDFQPGMFVYWAKSDEARKGFQRGLRDLNLPGREVYVDVFFVFSSRVAVVPAESCNFRQMWELLGLAGAKGSPSCSLKCCFKPYFWGSRS